ncbi:MAG: ImmA/IrrE family metallo-endopeptidase [Actinomycetota bacterium]
MDGPDQIEMLAQEVRRQWGLDAGPVADVAALMEGHGVLLARPLLATRQVDAFSVAFEDHPVVLLGADKGKRDRSRFDAAHELGHLVMHGPDYPQAEAERQAQQFAAALLMPQRDIRNELPARVDWNRLLALKGRWGTSIASLLYRARTLRVMKEPEYIRASKGLSARGWRVDEPGNLGPPEAPRLLSEAVRLAEEAGHTLLDIASEAGVPPEELSLILVAAQPRPRLSL